MSDEVNPSYFLIFCKHAGAIITEKNLSIKAKPSLQNKYSDGYR